MKREDLWWIYVKKNPKFVDRNAEIKFTAKGIRQFFERTFDHAFQEGMKVEQEKYEPDLEYSKEPKDYSKKSDLPPMFNDIFGQIFGDTRR